MSDDLAERCISLGRVLEEQWLLDAGHEIERLRTRLKWFEDAGGVAVTTKVYQQAAEIERMRGTLIELRLRLHAAGRRPEECHEMSMIDEALRCP